MIFLLYIYVIELYLYNNYYISCRNQMCLATKKRMTDSTIIVTAFQGEIRQVENSVMKVAVAADE